MSGVLGALALLGPLLVVPLPSHAPAQAQAPAIRCGTARACLARARAEERRPAARRDAARIEAYFARACVLGAAPACVDAGVLAEARGDRGEASSRYGRGCEAGDALACRDLAVMELAADPASVVARGRLESACQAGAALACTDLAAVWVRDGLPEQAEPARALLDRACDAGEPLACAHAGSLRLHEAEGPEGRARAIAQLEAACTGRVGHACVELAHALELGSRDDATERRVRGLYEVACDAGDGLGCGNLAVMRSEGRGGLAPDPAGAVDAFRRGCTLGAASACFGLGLHLDRGEGARADLGAAGVAMQSSCDGGYARACTFLAYRATGDAALALHRRACALGEASACDEVGERRVVVPSVEAQRDALEAFRRGCVLGLPAACAHEAELVRHGRGTARDPAAALRLHASACRRGSEEGCLGFADMLTRGEGTPADPARARIVLESACRGGGERACVRLR